MATQIGDRGGYYESKRINALGFDGEVRRDLDQTPSGWIARGKCRICGEIVEAGAPHQPRRYIMPGTSDPIEGILPPFEEHHRWHEIRRNAGWEAGAALAAFPDGKGADLMLALEKAVRNKVAGEREICARTVEEFAVAGPAPSAADVAARLRNPRASDYGVRVEFSSDT